MNTFEGRVTEALRTYGEDVVMTTQDIDRLERELETKQEGSRKDLRRRIWQGAVAACAVTGVVLGALALRSDPGPKSQPAVPPPVTLAQLEGIWRVDDSDWLWRFTADGKMIQSNQPDLLTRANTAAYDMIRPIPGGFTQYDPNDTDCRAWEVTIAAEGRLRGLVGGGTDPQCKGNPSQATEVWGLTRVSPVSVAGAAATAQFEPMDREPVKDRAKLTGTWLLHGTGTLLTVDSNQEYAVQDLGTTPEPETGSVSVRPDGTVTFTPKDAPTCTAVYESIIYNNIALDTKLASGSCDRLGATTNETWIRMN